MDADLKGHFTSLNRRNVSAFCKKLGVSENVFFLTAYNLSIGLFSNEKDTVSSSIHSGRTDSRWNRLAGPLFLTYFFRNKEGVDQTVPELLKTNATQIMDTMRCYISNLHADEMFFQYQGDILNIDTVGGYPAERQRMQLDSLPFHLQVFTDAKGYYYELRYWENRFDTRQLQDFLTVMESLMDAMQEETLVRRLSRRLPDHLFPLHYTITVEELNQAAKGQLVTGVDGKEPVKVYVFDENCRKKPFGAWGELYVMDCKPEQVLDEITNPYGPGKLYDSGRTARILPDGSLDFLEQGGRTIMQEGLTGRQFHDLYQIETALKQVPGVEEAAAYVRYADGNKLVLTAEVKGTMEQNADVLKAQVEAQCGKAHVPDILWK